MNTDEPAWYYVGDGRLRLWDGKQWTDRYRLANAPKPQPAVQRVTPVRREPVEQPGLPEEAGHGTRAVTWALLVAAAVLAAVVGFTLFEGPGLPEPDVPKPDVPGPDVPKPGADRGQPWLARSGRKRRSRRLFDTTNTDDRAIAPPAIIGLSRPVAASGSAAML